MAVKEVIVSDISGKDIPTEKQARLVIADHPSLSGPVELDVSTDEAGKLTNSKIELVSIVVHEQGHAPRRVVLDLGAFNETFKNVDMEGVLSNARPVRETTPAKRGRKPASAAPKVSYTDPEHFGQLHRGRITEEEAALVRSNLEQANANRAKAGQPPIDPNDEREKARYGF